MGIRAPHYVLWGGGGGGLPELPDDYDPVTALDWIAVYATWGPRWLDLGLGIGAAIDTWPDEAQAIASPEYADLVVTPGARQMTSGGTFVLMNSGQLGSSPGPSAKPLPYTLVWLGQLPATGSQRFVAAKRPGEANVPCFQITGGAFRAATGNGVADHPEPPTTGVRHLILAEFGAVASIDVDGRRTLGGAISGSPTMTGFTLGGAPADFNLNTSDAFVAMVGALPRILDDDERRMLLAWAARDWGVIPSRRR
jgi:hypothetical protein